MVPPHMDTGLIDDFGRPVEAGVALIHAPLAKAPTAYGFATPLPMQTI